MRLTFAAKSISNKVKFNQKGNAQRGTLDPQLLNLSPMSNESILWPETLDYSEL